MKIDKETVEEFGKIISYAATHPKTHGTNLGEKWLTQTLTEAEERGKKKTIEDIESISVFTGELDWSRLKTLLNNPKDV